MKSQRYAIVIEKGDRNYSGYAPDLPGCIATGETLEAVTELLREAIPLHLDSLRAMGEEIPEPTTHCDYVEAHLV